MTHLTLQPYDKSFFEAQSFDSLLSASRVLPEVFRYFQPQSLLDVGCGVGAWLRAAGNLGATERLGVDGDYVERAALMIPEKNFLSVDLAADDLRAQLHGRGYERFDMVMSMEVAEHLPFDRSAGFVADLCALGDVVLFSAAIPFQHGTGHINEQWPEFWATLFRGEGYACFDFLRSALWGERDVAWWYAQNLLVFVRRESAAFTRFPEAMLGDAKPLARVHPQAWLSSVLNLWHRRRQAARQDEPHDLQSVLTAWISGEDRPPLLHAVERGRLAGPDNHDVFPYTRTEVGSPEQEIAAACLARDHAEATLAATSAAHAVAVSDLTKARDVAEEKVAALEQSLIAATTRLAEDETRLIAADEAVATAEGKVAALEESLSAARAEVDLAGQANATLRQLLVRHEQTLVEAIALRSVVAQAEAEKRLLLDRAEAAERHVHALLTSTSWRITAPFRALRRG